VQITPSLDVRLPVPVAKLDREKPGPVFTYVAPEVFLGGDTTEASAVYSLSLALYYIVTGLFFRSFFHRIVFAHSFI
jgi:hypothetical protein